MHQYHIGRYYVKLWTRLQELPSDLVFDYWADRAHLHFQVPWWISGLQLEKSIQLGKVR